MSDNEAFDRLARSDGSDSDGGGGEAATLDRLDVACDEVAPLMPAHRSRNMDKARLHKKLRAEISQKCLAAAASEVVPSATFSVVTSAGEVSVPIVHRCTWKGEREDVPRGEKGASFHRIRGITLFRYMLHRDIKMQEPLNANSPYKMPVTSLRFKWDEAQQNIGTRTDDMGRHTQKLINTLVSVGHLKTCLMQRSAQLVSF